MNMFMIGREKIYVYINGVDLGKVFKKSWYLVWGSFRLDNYEKNKFLPRSVIMKVTISERKYCKHKLQ